MSAWLAAAYAVLALGLAWSLTGAASWRRRVPYILCAPPLALGLWLGRPETAGWPTSAGIPVHAQLVWASVDEPDPSLNDPGHVYLWLDVGGTAPRAYALPYSPQLDRQVQRAMRGVKRGQPLAVGRRSTGRASSHGHGHVIVRFYPHPPVVLPPKTH
ncbi:MAG: hypothetical protein JOY73_05360 [Actinobacteria bacterium]|nr:hypothetical protein [Actinomycetota bacterium]